MQRQSEKNMQQRQKQSVILVGMMASGKSTVGAELARRLGWDFFDTDEVIAKEKGKPVSQIFAEEGEAEFRCHETRTLAELTNLNRVVIATGGGVSDVLERTRNDTSRPLLQGDNPLGKIRSLLIERTPIYDAVSDKKVSVSRRTPNEIAEEILADVRIQDMIAASKSTERKDND